MSKHIFDTMEWALTPQAQERLEELEAAGLDKDIAYILVETFLGEEETYEEI